jgi:NAD(P)-dependent dehydrogenase (short-subunit alcohol dehydrogenase family)
MLVHNAGYLSDVGPDATNSADDWWEGFQVNVKGAFNVAQVFLRNAAAKGAVICQCFVFRGPPPFSARLQQLWRFQVGCPEKCSTISPGGVKESGW